MFKEAFIIILVLVIFMLCMCSFRENLLSDYDIRTRFDAQRSELGAKPRNETIGSKEVRDCINEDCDPYPTSQHPTLDVNFLTNRLYAGN